MDATGGSLGGDGVIDDIGRNTVQEEATMGDGIVEKSTCPTPDVDDIRWRSARRHHPECHHPIGKHTRRQAGERWWHSTRPEGGCVTHYRAEPAHEVDKC